LLSTFTQLYHQSPLYRVQAPGRVNLIGDHTDYNNGFVLPMTINYVLQVDFRPRIDRNVNFYSQNYQQQKSFNLDNIQRLPDDGWLAYTKGVAYFLQQEHALVGVDAVIHSNIPQGAGLSSSAALELAVARTFVQAANLNWDPIAMAKLAQTAENQWAGLNCGIMDQLVIAVGRKDHAILIDCADLSTQYISLPINVAVIVMDTMTRRDLTSSAYNERRSCCEQAVQQLQLNSLRDVSIIDWEHGAAKLSAQCQTKVRHVVFENDRVLQAAQAMQNNDSTELGRLMNASHASLRDDFAATNQQIDVMVELAQNFPGCYGARMTGGGFGGCAVALVKKDVTTKFMQFMEQEYYQATKLKPQLYVCHAVDGVNCTKF
jgi:galactokinase